MLRASPFIVACLFCLPAIAQEESEHRPVRPKGRYFTQDQLQRALQGAKDPGKPATKSHDQPPPPPRENMKALIDFAKQNPELTKSLLDAARDLMRDNPDLLNGNRDEAAKKIAEHMAKQSNLGDLLKQLDQKPPPSNVMRTPPEPSDQKGRRSRRKSPQQNPEGRNEPRPDTREPKGDAQHQPRREPDAAEETPKPSKNLLDDLAAQSPDFMKSLLEQAKKQMQSGHAPTREQVEDAVNKAAEAVKNDPAVAPWLNDPKTQEKLQSPELREAVRKMIAQQSASRRPRAGDPISQRPDQPPARQPADEPAKEAPPEQPPRNSDAAPPQPNEQGAEASPPQRPDATKRRRFSESLSSDEQTKKADAARKRVAKAMEEAHAKPGDREPERREPQPQSAETTQSQPSQADEGKDAAGRMADMLKQNPGLVESLLKSAGSDESKGGGQDMRESMKGLLDALKGTDIEKQAREFARELNKDGALDDLLKDARGKNQSGPLGGSAPRNPRPEPSSRSATEEASKAFKALAGEDFNASKLGDTMKSLGDALKKQTTGEERGSFSRAPSPSGPSAPKEGLGDGFLGMLGRGASKVGEWSAKASQSIAQNVAPSSGPSQINPPSFGELKSLTLPSAETGGKVLLVVGIVAALAVGAWLLLKRPETQVAGGPLFVKLPKLSLAGLPPREQAALLFERAALERLGEPARPKHHVTLAEKLCNGPSPDAHVLAEVYEAARYTPPTDPFQPDQVGVVRAIIARTGPPPKSVDGAT